VQIILDGVPIHLSGSSLPSIYILEQMHFHWDAEHTVDGQRDPLELHLVHYNKQYANFSTAVRYEDGIVVVSVLFKVGECSEDLLEIISEKRHTSMFHSS